MKAPYQERFIALKEKKEQARLHTLQQHHLQKQNPTAVPSIQASKLRFSTHFEQQKLKLHSLPPLPFDHLALLNDSSQRKSVQFDISSNENETGAE